MVFSRSAAAVRSAPSIAVRASRAPAVSESRYGCRWPRIPVTASAASLCARAARSSPLVAKTSAALSAMRRDAPSRASTSGASPLAPCAVARPRTRCTLAWARVRARVDSRVPCAVTAWQAASVNARAVAVRSVSVASTAWRSRVAPARSFAASAVRA